MRRTLTSTLLFLGIGLVLHVLISLFVVRVVLPDTQAWKRDHRFIKRPPEYGLIIAGSSHARRGVQAALLPGALNIAVGGESYVRSLYRLRWLLDQRSGGVHTVVLPFDAASFSSAKNDDFRPEAVWGRYVPYLERGAERGKPVEYFTMWAEAHAAPYVGEPDLLLQYAGSGRLRPLMTRMMGVRASTAEEVADRHFPEGMPVHDPEQVEAFREILALLRSHDIRVVLVGYPAHQSYLTAIEERGARHDLRMEVLDTVLEPGVVDFLDYEYLWPAQRGLYLDPDHLSAVGSRRFTARLGRDLRDLGVPGLDKK